MTMCLSHARHVPRTRRNDFATRLAWWYIATDQMITTQDLTLSHHGKGASLSVALIFSSMFFHLFHFRHGVSSKEAGIVRYRRLVKRGRRHNSVYELNMMSVLVALQIMLLFFSVSVTT